MKNPRTTLAGVCMLIGSLATFIGHWLSTGIAPEAEQWAILGGGLTAGAGLIAAADGSKK